MKLLSLMLAMAMLFTACGQSADGNKDADSAKEDSGKESEQKEQEVVESEYPEYLNVESAYPIIKDEYADDVTLSMAILMQSDAGEWDDLWISKYLSEKYNLNFEVEYITSDTVDERKSLMFASGEMPDIIINCNITTDEMVKYGAEEGLLLQIDSYMNETLTPNLLKYVVDDVKTACTATDGHMYTLPLLQNIGESNYNVNARLFINNAWLQELDLEIPRTLDEFVNAMYAIKEADPAGVGSENLYPLGGGMEDGVNISRYLLNALGYIAYDMGNGYGLVPALRDGNVVIPAYDMDVYKEYLTLMNQFYTDGIIAPTFFTIESTEINAYMNNGQTAMYNNAPYVSGIENWADFESCYPLTSEWQTEPEIAGPSAATVGGFVIAADTEYPEVCMRFADAWFNNTDDYCAALYGGYGIDSEYSFGYLQKEYLEESNSFAVDSNKTPGNINSWTYIVQYLNGNTWSIGAALMPESIERLVDLQGNPDYEEKLDTTGANVWRTSVEEHMQPYLAEGYPTIVYASAETSERITYLESVIEPYAEEQIALFITGARDLSEVDTFKTELKDLGMEELLDIYTELYNATVK